MSTSPIAAVGPQWNRRAVVTFAGQSDTNISTGEDYATVSLAEIFHMEPAADPKDRSAAFLPTLYRDFDARSHAVQRAKGEFVALCGDVDKGEHPLEHIKTLVRGFVRDAAWLIYSTANSRPANKRWRIVIPLERAVGFDDWHDAQNALFNFMEFSGVAMDRALDRAGQPVFLPNVPVDHASGEKLRDGSGQPLYYEKATSGSNAPGLSLEQGPPDAGITAIRRKRAEDDQAREIMRRDAEARKAQRPKNTGDGVSVMDEFNRSNSIANLLELYRYTQSPRHPEDWRSPHQEGKSYATRIMGDSWVSLSMSDSSAGVGARCKSGCFGDAYDLFVHYDHRGDHKAAHRALHAERRSSAPLPERYSYAAEEEAEYDLETGEPVYDMPDFDEAAPRDEAPSGQPAGELPLSLFNPSEWQDTTAPVREWRWKDFIPDHQATLLTGAGAAGKSLFGQQRATCTALGRPLFGIETKQCPALYITCEDDIDELHRRQMAICALLGVDPRELDGKLYLLSLQGEAGSELALFAPDGAMTVGPLYGRLEHTCLALGILDVTIDNTAHTFAGNENDRHQVAAYVNLNNGLAKRIGGSVLMVGHPNKAGDSYSGSTAWENQVRSRLYLEVPKGDDGVPHDPDKRVLRNEKANYSQRGAEVAFFWYQGAFLAADQMPENRSDGMRENSEAAYENALFLTLLDTLLQQRRHVSHAANLSNYAPKVMAAMPAAKGLSAASFKRAMERLFTLDSIAASQPLWTGRDRHPVLGLARKS